MANSSSLAEVSFEELRARLGDPSFVLLNVLPRAAFGAEHIPGSVNVPLEELGERARQTFLDLAREIIVYCASFT